MNDWTIRDKALQSQEIDRYRGRVEREFLRFARAPQERLSFVTIIGEPLVVEAGNHGDSVADALAQIERKLIARCRRSLPGMKIRGVHEVDVLAPNACRIGKHKGDLLRSLGVDVGTVTTEKRILIPHLHCVVDRSGHDSGRLADQMRAEFPGPWRTLVKPLFTDRSLRDNLESLAGYCTKMKVAYCDAWTGRTTKYADLYEANWVETVRLTLGTVGLENLYFSHGCAGLPIDEASLTAAPENSEILRPSALSTGSEVGAIDHGETIGDGSDGTIALHGCCGDAEMQSGRLDARGVFASPSNNLILIRAKGSAQRNLAPMGAPRFFQRRPGGAASTIATFPDPHPFHVSDLRKDSEDQFANTPCDLAQSLDLDDHTPVDEDADRCLHIERISTKPINGNDMKPIAIPQVAHEFLERRTIRRRNNSTHTLVNELAVEPSAQHFALSGNRLGSRGRPVICDAAHAAPWLKRYLIFMIPDHKSVKYLLSHLSGA